MTFLLDENFGVDDSYDFQGMESLDVCELDQLTTLSEIETNQDVQRGMKREVSWGDLVRNVSDDDDLSNDEHDELQDFLKEVGITTTETLPTIPESPIPTSAPELFECWGATIFPVADEQKVEPVGSMVLGAVCTVNPPPLKKRRINVEQGAADFPADPFLTFPEMPEDVNPPNQRKGKHRNKTRTTRQFVPLDEMRRLMAAYGPIVTPRKRKVKGSSADENGTGVTEKPGSIKRKFYRWFPDFEERFAKDPDGLTYSPRAGHDIEVAYRSEMRDMDQEILVHKRRVGRKGESRKAPMAN